MFKNNNIKIFFLVLISTLYSATAQDIHVTKINEDVIILHPKEIDNIESIRKVGGNMTVIRTDSGIVIVDSFISPEAGKNARNIIEDHFPSVPIRFLINTHHHADHIQGNQFFQDVSIIAHVNLLKHVSIPISIKIDTVLNISLGNKTFEIRYLGSAHTDNDIVVLDHEDKILIMGDLLCYRKCNIMGSESDAGNWINLLDKLIDRQSEYDVVIPGHGGVILNVESLTEQRDYLSNLFDAVKNIQLKNLNLDEVKNAVVLKKYKDYMMYDKIETDIKACWHQLGQ